MTKLIFGCGYLGQRVAVLWKAAGERVHVVTRSSERAREFDAAGYFPVVADIADPASLKNLPPADSVLFAVGFDRTAGRSMHEVYVDGLRNVLDALPGHVGRLIYISSTGVYGQTDGDWVDEESPCRPEREGGRACLAAEELLKQHAHGDRAIILRLAGIYGPGRIPRRDDLVAGRPIAAAQRGFLNLIHVDDAAQIVLAAEQSTRAPRTYVVSDGQPVERGEYYAELARLLHAPAPQFTPLPADSPAASRAGSDKRICTDRLRSELSFTLTYPSYREGLAAIVAS